MNVLLLGPQGAGKGTQARLLQERLGLPQISTGDMFRALAKSETPLAEEVRAVQAAGKLISDDLVIRVVQERTNREDCRRGYVLDGFPRTLAQARALDKELEAEGRQLKLALYLQVPYDVLVERAAGRWTCRTCQTTYNYRVNPPRKPGICDIDGGELYQREDDRLEVVSERIKVYVADTVPVVDYYRQRGILREIDGTRDIESVAAEIERQIGAAVW